MGMISKGTRGGRRARRRKYRGSDSRFFCAVGLVSSSSESVDAFLLEAVALNCRSRADRWTCPWTNSRSLVATAEKKRDPGNLPILPIPYRILVTSIPHGHSYSRISRYPE